MCMHVCWCTNVCREPEDGKNVSLKSKKRTGLEREEEGCNVLEKIDESDYGKFAWVIDPDGNKVELWEPPAGQ